MRSEPDAPIVAVAVAAVFGDEFQGFDAVNVEIERRRLVVLQQGRAGQIAPVASNDKNHAAADLQAHRGRKAFPAALRVESEPRGRMGENPFVINPFAGAQQGERGGVFGQGAVAQWSRVTDLRAVPGQIAEIGSLDIGRQGGGRWAGAGRVKRTI